MWISVLSTIVIRVPVAYVLAYFTRSEQWPNGAPEALSVSLLVSWTLGMVLSVIAYRMGTWKTKMYASAKSHGHEV